MIHFITGLPRSGASLISAILKQNPSIHTEISSSLADILKTVNLNWQNFPSAPSDSLHPAKLGVLSGILKGYYQHTDKPIILDHNKEWVSMIPLLESILNEQIRILVCVRNPAEILTSFERSRKENPLYFTEIDQILKQSTSIAARAFFYAGPDGILGRAHRNINDAIIMGYLDRMLFIDYSRFCNSPKSQTKRIYDFLKLPIYEHDVENIEQTNPFTGKTSVGPIAKKTVNCVEYLGLNLYEQYNREIFWNAWV